MHCRKEIMESADACCMPSALYNKVLPLFGSAARAARPVIFIYIGRVKQGMKHRGNLMRVCIRVCLLISIVQALYMKRT